MTHTSEFLTIDEFSTMSRLSVSTIRRPIADGSLPAFQPGGKKTRLLIPRAVLATGTTQDALLLWNAASLEPALPPLVGHRGWIGTVAFSPDSRKLVTGGEENTVKVWDVATGRELHTFRGHNGDVYAVAFSRHDDGRWVASGGEDSSVKIWDTRSEKLAHSFRGHTALVSCLTFGPDDRRLYSGSRDKTVRVWDLKQLGEGADR